MEENNKVKTGYGNPPKEYQFKPGESGNPKGRPRNPLKEFSLRQFASWTEEQMTEFLNKIPAIDRWRMTEGNPAQDLTTGGEKIQQTPIYAGNSIQGHISDPKDIQPDKKD